MHLFSSMHVFSVAKEKYMDQACKKSSSKCVLVLLLLLCCCCCEWGIFDSQHSC